ncbi:hypothetical protein CL622_06270 [archaeon]|nr:hypothetical protein [archaeon]|tara:strand:- start:998 stop:2986 length:1989 start_codon:yes stop_codon:yes gene_type:complete
MTQSDSYVTPDKTPESVKDTLGITTETFVGAAYPSQPVTLINIPEPRWVKGDFVYNYYVRDERTNGNGTVSVTPSDGSQTEQQIAKSEKMPRYVKITVGAAEFGNNDKMLESIASGLGPSLIDDNLELMQFEGAIASGRFSGIKLQDDQIDQSFYYALSSSISFFGAGSVTSGNTQSSVISSNITASAAFGPNGETIRDALSNIQSQGVSYAPTDVRNDVTNDAFRSVRFIDFGLNINNITVSNIIKGSVEDKTNIYQNEIESMSETAAEIQSNAIAASTPGVMSSDEWQIPMEAIDTFSTSEFEVSTDGSFNESSIPIGFYIEKFEIVMKDEENFDRVNHSPLIVNQYGDFSIQDTSIKYGSTYIYNIKTVALTRFEALKRDESGNVEDEIVVAVVMVASSGLMFKVNCVETIPPEPPGNVSFKYDYKNDHLMIFWEEPLNPQRDVVRYQIFRRKSINVPFTLIREYDFDLSTSRVQPVETAPDELITRMAGARKFFRDIEFGKESKYIYAICCVDARGFTSNYSAQFEVSFSTGKNKLQTNLVSKKNAPKPYPNIYLNTDLFVDTMKDSGHSRMRIFFDPEYYDVYRDRSGERGRSLKQTQSLKLIANNYKLQIINVDNQLSKLINIKVSDLTGSPLEVPVSETNMSSISNLYQDAMDST